MSPAKEISKENDEYTLTWEEYLELYSDAWDKPNLVAVVTTTTCAVVFGLVAFLLFRGTGGQDNNVLWIFWALPAMLIAFAVWELRFRPRESNKKKRKEIRSSFDRFYQERQMFHLDEQGWKHQTSEKRQEGTWASLLLLLDRPTVIALCIKDALIVVPKRQLDAEALALIRQTLSGEGPEYSFASTFWDWASMSVRQLWKKQFTLLITANAAGIASIVFMARRLGSPSKATDFFWGELLCLVVLCLIVSAQLWYFPLKYACSKHHKGINFKAKISAAGIWVTDSEQQYFRAWKLFMTVEETSLAFLLYTDQSHFLLFSKRLLSSEQQDEVRKFLNSRMASTS